ncbi:MAG: DNA repair protein RadA [Gammaproteobacteria bacterium]|nr:DNA repair protein RadA [Gammaproteobacteria bacterium]
MTKREKSKTSYVCQACAANYTQWAGHCGQCGAWNSLIETQVVAKSSRSASYAQAKSAVILATDVSIKNEHRVDCGLSELNRVLGGGLVDGSVVLIGGDPGIGKSTLLIQTLAFLSASQSVLYVTGEESLQQVVLRAKRLQLDVSTLHLLAETQMDTILSHVHQLKPRVVVIDSIQTLFSEALSASAGSVSQVRECAGELVRFAKHHETAVFLIGHVTKEGAIAGPRVLEHMVDCVLYFEGERDSRFRVIRAIKNRFGAVNELGMFAMTEKGLKAVGNPSAMFLSRSPVPTPGNVTFVSWEGSRPILVEVQALVDQAYGPPKRVSAGLEGNRLSILLAVLHRHAGIASYDQDVFLNVVGGVKITEAASDLALLMAIVSSLKNQVMDLKTVVFGEIGLSGEVRPVQQGQERLKEAAKHGFKRAIVPLGNVPKQTQGLELEIIGVQSIREVFDFTSSRISDS